MSQGSSHQGPVTTPPTGAPVEILPENIAGRSGMPRESGVEHSLHDVSDRATTQGREANARLQAGLQDTTEQAREGVRTLRDQAADRASDVRNRVSEAADSVRERTSETYEDARSWAEDRFETHRRRAADLADRGTRRLHEGRTATEQFVTENPLLVGVVGLVGILLFGASTVSIARRLSRGRAVAIEVTDSGICWRAWSDDLIAWDDIDHVEVRRQGRHHHLCLWLHRPTHFRSALATHGARLSKDMGFGDVAINTVGTDRRFDELVEAVRRHVTPD